MEGECVVNRLSKIAPAVLMTAMLCFLLTLSGCKSSGLFGLNPERVDETRTAIQSTISEPERRVEMLAIVDSMEAKLKAVGAEAVKLRQDIVEKNRDYDTPREKLERLYAKLGSQVEKLTTVVKEHSLQLRGHCSEVEWEKIASRKTKDIHFKF